jgi:hypothetical protein
MFDLPVVHIKKIIVSEETKTLPYKIKTKNQILSTISTYIQALAQRNQEIG